ncbi:hypothetical protein ACFQZZ_01175 [Nocardia sp. GCM10030253]|uniref:hypothetical protein n=1 Tax=Nocardia sp. GCM10030253 TaxID=3273404 RepID=UPI00363BED83
MSPAATEAAARRHLHEYFIETLRTLPPKLSLALYNPAIPTARLGTGITMPCNDDDDSDGIGPKYFDISYWLVGTTPDASDAHFDLVTKAWNSMGWGVQTERNSRPRAAFTRTPDGYGLSIQQSVNGYLSLSGSTPPFPPGTAGGNPLPTTIGHPGVPAVDGDLRADDMNHRT